MCLDNDLLVDSFKTEVEFLRNNWQMLGRPTITIPVTHAILGKGIKDVKRCRLKHPMIFRTVS